MQLTQKKSRRGDLLTAAAVAMLLAVMAALLYTGSLTRQVTNMLIPTAVYIVMAVSLNLVVGLLGELSLGHAGFMSVGLFSGCLVAIALTNTALPLMVRLPVSMLAGGLTAAVFGLLVGLPTLRLRGDYLAIVTLACGEIIKNIKAQDDEYLLQTLTGKDGELCPVHNKKPSIFPIPGRDDDDDGGSGSWQDWWDKLRP